MVSNLFSKSLPPTIFTLLHYWYPRVLAPTANYPTEFKNLSLLSQHFVANPPFEKFKHYIQTEIVEPPSKILISRWKLKCTRIRCPRNTIDLSSRIRSSNFPIEFTYILNVFYLKIVLNVCSYIINEELERFSR